MKDRQIDGWIDGYFINPEGYLGHPVAYTLNLTHKHTYTNHSRITVEKQYTQGKTCSQGVGCIQILYRYYTDITVCIDCVSVDVHKESSAKSADRQCSCACVDSAKIEYLCLCG